MAVAPAHVAQVVSRLTRIPVERVSASDRSALASLGERISRRLVGQHVAIRTVVDAIRRGREGLADAAHPWGVFLFIGPPGAGKTELAKVLAEEVYGGPEGLIRFDMGDFTEPHSTAKLLGAPPGYIGYDRGAPLVQRLRAQPYSLLLFDEIEQAHENVLGVLLRLLSEGTLVDVEGTAADCRNSIVIMTSNIGADRDVRVGFASDAYAAQTSQQALRLQVEGRLTRQFVDRLDAVVRFNPLSASDLELVAQRKLREFLERARDAYGVVVRLRPRCPDVARGQRHSGRSGGAGDRTCGGRPFRDDARRRAASDYWRAPTTRARLDRREQLAFRDRDGGDARSHPPDGFCVRRALRALTDMAFLQHDANVSSLEADGDVMTPPSPLGVDPYGVEPREIAMLADRCAAALEARGTSVTSAERDREWLSIIAVTLVAAPPELGGETATPEMVRLAARSDANARDANAGSDANAGEEWPELRACRLWIACASGAPPAGAAAEFTLLLDTRMCGSGPRPRSSRAVVLRPQA